MCLSCLTRRRFLLATPAALTLGACDEAPDIISDEMMAEMGAQSWAAIRQSTPLSPNADLQAQVDRVALRLLDHAATDPAAWEVEVFDSPEANAFALPGGKIGVFTGMLRITENEAQLATVLGHEIGHLQAEHGKKRVQAQLVRDIGLRALTAALGAADVEYAAEIGAALGIGVEYGLLRPYSRDHEREADVAGLRLMDAAGFDPAQAAVFWDRMEAQSARRGPAFLSTHPAPGDRADDIRELVRTL